MRAGTISWLATLAATAASTYALDAIATAAGLLLVASGLLGGLSHVPLLAFLAASYLVWGAGLRASLRANWDLLCRTGASTNALSKAAFDLARRRGTRVQRVVAGAGYVATELAKEAPYYAGAFGAALVTDSVSTNEAVVFLGGANLGAAAYEYGLARITRALLRPPPPAVRVVRRRLGAARVPRRLLPGRRAGRARDDRILRRCDPAGARRRAGAGAGDRPDAAPRLPRRGQGVRDPPGRLPSGQPRGARALAHAAPRGARLARVRPLHAGVRRPRGADRRRDRPA